MSRHCTVRTEREYASLARSQFPAVSNGCPHVCALQDVGFKLMPKLSHRNTRRLAAEGRQRELQASAAAARDSPAAGTNSLRQRK